MRKPQNPKAENIARDLLRKLGPCPPVTDLLKQEEKPVIVAPKRDTEVAL